MCNYLDIKLNKGDYKCINDIYGVNFFRIWYL